MRGRSCSGPQSRSCPQDICVWSISLEERRNIYIFKTLCKHLAVQAERHWTAGLWWQWWVLVADQTEKQLDLFQRKRKNRSFKVYVSRVAILPVLPRWVPLSRCCWQSSSLWAGGMRVLVLFQSQLRCLGSLRQPGAGRCHGRLGWDSRKQN